MQRYVQDYCIEIWNITQRWEELNGSTYNLLEKIVNNRLCLMYARSPDVVGRRGVENEESESGLSALLLNEELSGHSTSSTKLQRARLEQNEISRVTEEIMRDVEELVALVNVQMTRIVNELQSMRERLAGLKKLENIKGEGRSPPHLQSPKLKEMNEILPVIVKMYQDELKAKHAALDDLANFDSRDVFLAITASWSHQAFIDRPTLSRLYSLIV
ncbi:unnamed protein product [Litomosoides sigmodontis]|uniref:Uncharacterized protein n=1 Tax=Litomosoides sigmodontis TaxID=42156 RepID=A0A3P6UB94_LITSI|nr:unnamed protein product [Litomosoides sigmodontis]